MVVKNSFIRNLVFFYSISSTQKEILIKEITFYSKLSSSEKKIFEHRVSKFIKKHKFVGQNVIVSEVMKVLIAATAIQLTFGLKSYLYDLFHTIIIYPSVYQSTVTKSMHKGESNPKLGVLVFSWEDFVEGMRIENDNLNLGLHEFTHALHFSFLKKKYGEAGNFLSSYEELLEKCTKEFMVKMRADTYIRSYAHENAYELLSVLIECFFETPKQLKEGYPFVYVQLSKMLNLDTLKSKII